VKKVKTGKEKRIPEKIPEGDIISK
jgi:hypothetical protein